jgi:hypothetical protein
MCHTRATERHSPWSSLILLLLLHPLLLQLYLERNAAHLLPSQQPLGGLPEDEYEYEEDEDLGAGGGAEAGEGGSGEGTLEPSTS